MRSSLAERALRAALAVAAEHGLRCERPVVLNDSSNLLVRLDPAPVVARVTTVTSLVRGDDGWLRRELEVAGHLVAAGAPVVAPSAELPPGPHGRDGLTLSFWTYVDEGARPLDAHEAGRRLRICHDALERYAGELPRWGVLDEAHSLLDRLAAAGALADDDAALLRRVGTEVRARLEEFAPALQPIHGDAHLHNVIAGPDGPLWNDWEDTFLGPRAWDLGCLHGAAVLFGRDPAPVAAAQRGYGEGVPQAQLGACIDARRFQGTLWSVVMAGEQPARRARAESLLAFYRERG
jgi:hypothetical protein